MGRPKGSKNKVKSGTPGTEGTAEAWDAAAAAAASADKRQGRLALDVDEEQVRVELELATPLSPAGLLHAAQKMAHAKRRIEHLESEIDVYTKPRKTEIKALEKDLSTHAREVETESEWSVVSCIEVHQYRTNTVSVFRLTPSGDLGEHVRDRPMTAKEREKATFDVCDGERIDVEEDPPPPDARH